MMEKLLQSMTSKELIDYCLILRDELDAKNDYIRELKMEMEAYEEYRDAKESAVIAYSNCDKAESNTIECENYIDYMYNLRTKKKKAQELKVMDLNNDPETDKKQKSKYKPGDIVWVYGLMGRYKILEAYISKTGNWSYSITSFDYSDDTNSSVRTVAENSIAEKAVTE